MSQSKKLLSAYILILLSTCIACRHDMHAPVYPLKILPDRKFSITDSLKTFNDSLSFEYFITARWKSNQILAFQLPVLNLSVMDTLGNISREIARAGLKEQQYRSQFLDAKWMDKRLYVLAEGNYFSLSIYDSNLHFLKKVHLQESIKDSYVPLKTCSFAILKGKNGNLQFLVSNGDTRYPITASKYYKKGYGLLTFQLDPKDRLVNVEKKLPLYDFPSIQAALDKNTRNWNAPNIMFAAVDSLLYVKPVFDQNIYVYRSDDLTLQRIYQLPLPDTTEKGFSQPFDTGLKYNSDAMSQIRLQYRNIKYVDLKYSDGNLYLMLTLPVPAKDLPKSPKDIGAMQLTCCVYKIDPSSLTVKTYRFGSKYNPYNFYLKDDDLLLSSNPYATESPFLYTIKTD